MHAQVFWIVRSSHSESLSLCLSVLTGIYLDQTSSLFGLAPPVLQSQGGFWGYAWLEVGGAWCLRSCRWAWADFPPSPLTKSSLATDSPLCQGLLRGPWAKPTTGLPDERGKQRGGTPWTQGHPTVLMTLSLVPLSLAHSPHRQSTTSPQGADVLLTLLKETQSNCCDPSAAAALTCISDLQVCALN